MAGDIADTGPVSTARIAPLLAEFTDAGLDRLFQDHQHAQNRNTLRLVIQPKEGFALVIRNSSRGGASSTLLGAPSITRTR